MATKKPTKKAPAEAGEKRGNLAPALANWRGEQLRRGMAGNVAEAREVHAVLAQLIRDSDISEPYRDWLAWMHQQIAEGADAGEVCAVMPKPGNFSKFKRNFAIWQAIDSQALADGTTWQAAARRIHENPRAAVRLAREYPDFEMPVGRNHEPASLATLMNIYRGIQRDWEADRHE